MTPIDQTKMASTVTRPGARSVGHPLKQALWVFLAALLAVSVLAPRVHAAFGYRMPITIDKSKVSGTQSNFPVLISITSASLKSGSGGHVQNGSGYDIVFRASDGTTALPHEVERYIAIDGTITAWVKIPTISSAANTLIYVYYGDSSISAATETPASVWDSNYKAVFHLHDDEKDSTSNPSPTPAANHSSTNGAGKIADGQVFNGTNQWIQINSSANTMIDTNLTISAWVKASAFPASPKLAQVIAKYASPSPSFKLQLDSTKKTNFSTPGRSLSGTAGEILANTWYLLTAVQQGTSKKIYINGNVAATASDGSGLDPESMPVGIGASLASDKVTASEFFTGSIDEVRISNSARSVDWIKTEYNNQNSPGTFHSFGPEENIGAPVTYQITAISGSNGSVSPSGVTTLTAPQLSQTYTVTANSGYKVNQVLVKKEGQAGAPVSLVGGQYAFTNVDANYQISASFSAVVVTSPDPLPPSVPGCGQNVGIHYGATGFKVDDFELRNVAVKDPGGILYLNTGYGAIDPNQIVIPFDQEVSVTFFYENAGYRNDFGWVLASEGINGTKHPIYTDINDTDRDGILDVFEGTGTDLNTNRKVLGTFTGGTEIVFYMRVNPGNDGVPASKPYFDIFTKKDWNADTYTSIRGECTDASFTKKLNLGQAWSASVPPDACMKQSNWMEAAALDRAKTFFGLDFTGATATIDIVRGQKYSHAVAAVPTNKPNEWVLGWEDFYEGGDMDYNDFVFVIERRTGGYVQTTHPIVPARAEDYFTAVTAQIWDRVPCPGKTGLKYYFSIDNGAHWTPITDWDEIWETDAAKTKKQKLASWTPGTPEYTYRTVRLDFAGLGIIGRELTWKAEMMSNQQGCEPEILDVKLAADVASHAFFSRASPVVKANVIYSGYYETPAMNWLDKTLRGHLSATRLYAPDQPNETAEQALWDAGTVLSTRDPDSRTIYFPEISIGQMSNMQIGAGNGTDKTFTGTIDPAPISATTLTITDGRETFHDKHTDVLEGSLGGTGTINRYTGVFILNFNEAPANGAAIVASYTYYAVASALQTFVSTHIHKETMGLDDSALVPSGFKYDFDGNNIVNDNDAHLLMNWVKGYELGTAVKRQWLLDPIDHSVPALETAPGLPLWYFGTATTEQERDSYDQFMAAQATRRAVIYAGSRSGMLHAFDAGAFRYGDNPETKSVKENRGYFEWTGSTQDTADYGTGAELWAFIPANLLPRLKNNLLARQHMASAAESADQGYVDASPALADVYINGAWRTVLLSAEGNGGDTVFCLDVTDPASPSYLWEFSDPDLFRSRSSPSVAKIGRIVSNGKAKWVAFFVSGKDNRYDLTQYPSVYMIDIETGAVLQRVLLNAEPLGIGGVPSGQPSTVDSDGNGYIDRFYIGTDKGFLYKVNIPDDPSSVKYAISVCVVNKDYTDGAGNTIASDRRYQPIYGSPVVVVGNTINEGGSLNYNVKIFYGTGDSPYYAESIDMAGTRYHFLAYVDTAEKGECSDAAVSLDWYYELPEGQRVFASAFAAAGMIYFGTSTADTEDPCATDSQTNNNGEIFAFDTNAPKDPQGVVTPAFRQRVGNTVTPPLVEDQHLYIKNQSGGGLQSFGAGVYNNEVLTGGFPQIKVKIWREIF
jgi:hypothetical protein